MLQSLIRAQCGHDWPFADYSFIFATISFFDIDAVMQRYFAAQPLFAVQGTKKHEFPDAVTLLALEAWVAQQQTKVMVVSQDGDWKRYCVQSARLVLVTDLADALGAFQEPTARYACKRVAELLGQDDRVGLQRALEAALKEQDDRVLFEIKANQAINARMCKHQHMRWTPCGAHLLAQVRCAVINGDLATKLAAYRARIHEVPEDVTHFLAFMQHAAEAQPHAF